MTCLPDFLWTDPRALYLKKRRRRLWMLLVDMERLRGRWHPDDVATWPDCVWAANLDVTERRFALDVAELRALGLMDAERIALTPCREPEAASSPAPRPSYPSDKNRSRALRNDSAATPQMENAEPQTTPQATPPHVHARGLSQAKPSQAKPSLAEPGLEKNLSLSFSSQAKPSQAEAARASPLPPKGQYKHRTEPNEQELLELQTRFLRADIEEAIREVQGRDNFEGVGNWIRYLGVVIPAMQSKRQQTLPAEGMLGTVPGGSPATRQAARPRTMDDYEREEGEAIERIMQRYQAQSA